MVLNKLIKHQAAALFIRLIQSLRAHQKKCTVEISLHKMRAYHFRVCINSSLLVLPCNMIVLTCLAAIHIYNIQVFPYISKNLAGACLLIDRPDLFGVIIKDFIITPVLEKVSPKLYKYNGAKVSRDKIKGASSYAIYIKNSGGSYILRERTKGTEYTLDNIATGAAGLITR